MIRIFKKEIFIFFTIGACIALLTSCSAIKSVLTNTGDPTASSSPTPNVEIQITLKINQQAVTPQQMITLNIGDTLDLQPQIIPTTVNQNIIWTFSTPNVVTISATGLLTALTAGETRLNCIAVENPSVSVNIILIVKELISKSIIIQPTTSITLSEDQVFQLSAVDMSDNQNIEVNWFSSSTPNVEVTPTGLLRAKNSGTALITAISKDGKKESISPLMVTVTANDDLAKSITMNTNEVQTSALWNNSDQDYFQVNIPAITTYQDYFIKVQNLSDNLQIELTIYDKNQAILYTIQGDTGKNLPPSIISSTGGTYYLKVTSVNQNSSGNYQITVETMQK